MANKINAKLILELKASGLSRNQIAVTRHMSKHSVSDVINIAKEKEITYEKVKHFSEEEIYRMIFPDKFAIENLYEQPDYEYVHQELKRVGVTLKLLWQEYQDKCKTSGSIPMGYTKYCNGYADYTIVNKLTNHLENKPGVKAEVDWSGPTMSYCQYIGYHQSIVLQGPTGSGKTYLACALAKQACLGQIKTKYIRLPDLLMEYGDASIIQGKQKRLLASYSKIPLLVIDEWLVSDMSDSELYFLFELFERRSDTTSTIFCTQYRQEDWIMRLNESVQAEAIVDRYAHTSFWIEMGSMNMREYCAKHKI